jgi:perosamine synthetase
MENIQYIPFGKPNFSQEEIDAITKTLNSGWVGMGPEVLRFEEELSKVTNATHVVTVSSCTDALFLSLLVSGVKSGDEVICPSLTWCSTANSALFLQAKPVFCDIDHDTLCLNIESVKSKISEKTKAVIVVHYGGLAVDVDQLRSHLPSHIAIIEDAAHAFGSYYPDGKPVGSSGNLTCFSFYANKNLSTGEGGAIATNDSSLADNLRSLRQHALPVNAWSRYSQPQSLLYAEISRLGYKMNYTDLQASIGRVQLKRQKEFARKRLNTAELYHNELSPIPKVKFQSGILSNAHARHLFVVRIVNISSHARDDLILKLRSMKVGASLHYAPLHNMPLYDGYNSSHLATTEEICSEILTLPIGASLSMEESRYIATCAKGVILDCT